MQTIARADFDRKVEAAWADIDKKPSSVAVEWVLNMVGLIGRGEAIIIDEQGAA